MISSDDFLLKYWKHYIQLEKEFSFTVNYVAIDSVNYDTYSDAYLKIILQVGSEIDVSCKLLCSLLGESIPIGNIRKYKKCIIENIKDFFDIRIKEKLSGINSCPWEEWKLENGVPTWWTIYNKIKHHRISVGTISGTKQEYYKFANLKYTLLSLMGLYQLMLYSYYFIAKNEGSELLVPLPSSRLFDTKSSVWKELDKGSNDISIFNESDGTLHIYTGKFDY